MRIPHLRLAAIALAALGLSGCATYDPFGYGGLSVGYGSGGYYDPYYGGYGYGYSPYGYQSSYGYGYSPYGYQSSYGYGYSPYGYQSSYGYGYSPYGYQSSYGYGYSSPYRGWNDGYYYPGTGYYVYDNLRRPHRWSDSQRRYWTTRTATGTTTTFRQNWTGFTRDRQSGIRATRVDRSGMRGATDPTTRVDRQSQVRSNSNGRGNGRNRRGNQSD